MGAQAFKKEDGSYDPDGYFQKQLEDDRLQKADTLEELAGKLGFDAEAKRPSWPRASAITNFTTLRKTPTSLRNPAVCPSCVLRRFSAPRWALRC